jgi:hypothetical protein
MTKRVINEVQEFLTVVSPDHTFQIVNVEMLLKRHPPDAVVGFLTLLRADYKKELKELLKENKRHPKVNYLVVNLFRLRMAIKTIQRAQKEVKRGQGNEAEQRAAESGGLS